MLTSSSGLNQRLTPVTSAKLHRWVRILDRDTLDFELQPVTVKKNGRDFDIRESARRPKHPGRFDSAFTSRRLCVEGHW
jgi:hypothetical protein